LKWSFCKLTENSFQVTLPPSKLDSLKRLFIDIFNSPIDAYDYYINGKVLTQKDLFLFHLLLWIYAPIFKIILNKILLFNFEANDETSKLLITDGLILSFLIYPILYIIGIGIEKYRIYYKKNEYLKGDPIRGLGSLAFLPISASSIFWILPKPFNAFGILISIIYSVRLYYSSLLNMDNFNKIDFKRLFLYFLISGGIMTLLIIIVGNTIRAKL
jgi:hypothetical protein